MSPSRSPLAARRRARTIAVAAAASLVTAAVVVSPAVADQTTMSNGNLRTAWFDAQPKLTPSAVLASNFGQVFSKQLNGQIYAQPVVSNGTMFVATENNWVYGINPGTGDIKWGYQLSTNGVADKAWNSEGAGFCNDLSPSIGVTSTPVIDPAVGAVYFTSKVEGATPSTPIIKMHALNLSTGAERAGFPTIIGGNAQNQPGTRFDPKLEHQRPGLLLLDGRVYAGFGSHCGQGDYTGFLIGVDATSGKQTAMWASEPTGTTKAGIWQSGGGLVSDRAGQILLSTGQGTSVRTPTPGSTPPAALSNSLIRLTVQTDGTLKATDFFSPSNNKKLDEEDRDLGSAGPLALPDGYGTAQYPHLLVQGGKEGRVYLVNRDDLGGYDQGPGGANKVFSEIGPSNGIWGHPAFFGQGDGTGYVYTVTSDVRSVATVPDNGRLMVYRTGVDSKGLPSLSLIGKSADAYGYTSGSPVVTSDGTTAGSGVVWAVYSQNSGGSDGQLRAYNATPGSDGTPALLKSWKIGDAAKFSQPVADDGKVYVGTRAGTLLAFGATTTAAVTGPASTDFGKVDVGASVTRTVTVTAARDVTVTQVTSDASSFSAAPSGLPKKLTAGTTYGIPVTYAPKSAGATSGNLSIVTDGGTAVFGVTGTATAAGISASLGSIDFGKVNVGQTPAQQTINITNTGSSTATITGVTGPGKPFSIEAPATGTAIAAGKSVQIKLGFSPTAGGAFTDKVTVTASTGSAAVTLTGTGVDGAPIMTITPSPTLAFGSVPVNTIATRDLKIANTGTADLVISIAKAPGAPFSVSNPLNEGTTIPAGASVTERVTFAPTATQSYSVTANFSGNAGGQTITFTGTGTPASSGSTNIPSPSSGTWTLNGTATQNGDTTDLTPLAQFKAGSAVYPTAVPGAGLHATFTAELGGGNGADGMTFALLDAAKSSGTSIGGMGGALGFGGLAGTAVTLDTFQNGADPSSNFVGIGTGTAGGGGPVLIASQNLAASLRTGTHVIDVTTTASAVTVSVDGGTPLTASVALPEKVLLAFTGGTGGTYDYHRVSSVTITSGSSTTTPPPTPTPTAGTIVGVGGTCLGSSAGASGNGTQLPVATCDGTTGQNWTVGAGNTLTLLGKCLDIDGAQKAAGSKVQLWTCNGTAAQVWMFAADGTIRNPNSVRCLSVPGDTAVGNPRVTILDCAASPGQLWKKN